MGLDCHVAAVAATLLRPPGWTYKITLFCIFLSTNVFDNGSNKEFGVKMFLIEVSRGGPNLFFIIFLFQACLICSKSNQCLLNATQVL